MHVPTCVCEALTVILMPFVVNSLTNVIKRRLGHFDWTEEVKNYFSSKEKFSNEDKTDYAAVSPLEVWPWTEKEEKREMPKDDITGSDNKD